MTFMIISHILYRPSETDLKRLYRRAMDVDVKDKMMDSLKKIAQHNKYVSYSKNPWLFCFLLQWLLK